MLRNPGTCAKPYIKPQTKKIIMKIAITLCALLLCGGITLKAAEKSDKPKVSPEEAFKRRDADKDGKVSKEEFLKGQKDATKAEATFAAKDKDKDGSLSKEEFLAAGKKKAK